MTEAQWLASNDPAAMLSYLLGNSWDDAHEHEWNRHPSASDRKLRIFACACCRQLWEQLTDEEPCGRCRNRGKSWEDSCPDCGGTGRINYLRWTIQVAERYADGRATEAELTDAYYGMNHRSGGGQSLRLAIRWCATPYAGYTPYEKARNCAQDLRQGGMRPGVQSALLRCIFGNPWRPIKPVVCGIQTDSGVEDREGQLVRRWHPKFLAWNDGTVPKIAQRIYDERDWSQMGVLADALEDAGCTDEALLMHCRGYERCPCLGTGVMVDNGEKYPCAGCYPSPVGWRPFPVPGLHARGCWVVDLLLGKD